MINVSERLKNYLNEPYIQNLINNNNYEKLYRAVNYSLYSELTFLLFKVGINPLNYLNIIPAHFLDRSNNIQTINIPENIVEIGEYAFYNSTIEHVIIPNNVLYCGINSFAYCYKLRIVYIGDGLEVIFQDMFYNCRNLVRVTLGANIKVIRPGAFKHCPKLTTIHYDGNLSEFTGIDIDVDAFDRDHTINIVCKNGTIKLF